MLTNTSRMWLAGGIWITAVTIIVASSVAMEARVSTSALLLVLSAVPMGVALLIGLGAPPPTVAEILHAVNTKNSR